MKKRVERTSKNVEHSERNDMGERVRRRVKGVEKMGKKWGNFDISIRLTIFTSEKNI